VRRIAGDAINRHLYDHYMQGSGYGHFGYF